MSIDGTGLTLWEMKKPPLALLVAGRVARLVMNDLSAEQQAPFLSLTQALTAWWPRREPAPKVIYEHEFRACLDAYAAFEPQAKMKPAIDAAYVQMAALLRVAPRTLPTEGLFQLDEADFRLLLRAAAKASRLPIAQLDARLTSLLEHAKEPWPELVARVDRMSWVRGAPWSKLDKRLRALASLADLGANSSWTDVAGKQALRIELDGTARIALLTPEEHEALRKVVPSVVDAL